MSDKVCLVSGGFTCYIDKNSFVIIDLSLVMMHHHFASWLFSVQLL